VRREVACCQRPFNIVNTPVVPKEQYCLMNTLLVVCTANVCCSPMAQAILTRALPDTRVMSGGFFAVAGMTPHSEVVKLMHSEGYDIQGHRAKAIASPMLDAASLILVMTSRQKHTIERCFPSARGKTFRFGENRDVMEPCMNGRTRHSAAFMEIREGAERWAWHISRLQMESAYAALM
jgi:protein-tyrosine phosphatase